MVLEALRALAEARRATSVNDMAHELGVDQSGASRMITHAERQGLVTRRSPARIGAPTTIAATAAGTELLRHAHAWQNDVARRLTADWPAEDVATLTTLMNRLVQAQTDLDATTRASREQL